MKKEVLKSALNHLNKNTNMKILIDEFGTPEFSSSMDNFNSLVKSIIYQQLSGKAAKTIYNRFLILYDNNLPKPKNIINTNHETLRSIGLSKQKSKYILGLAEYFVHTGSNIKFRLLSNFEVSQELIKLNGIGQWTVDMFLMFTLFRTDIFPVSDLGIQKGIKTMFNLKKLPTTKEMIQKSEAWKPYRTIACWYLWRMVDGEATW